MKWTANTEFTTFQQRTLVQALLDVIEPQDYLRRKGEINLNKIANADNGVSLCREIAAEGLHRAGVKSDDVLEGKND